MENTETLSAERGADSQQRVVSLRFGVLKYTGCKDHPHRLDLSCAKIRNENGDPLSMSDIWQVLQDMAAQANKQ